MNTAISLNTVHELFHYNYWARDRQLQLCATLSEEQFKQPLPGSFASLQDTLAHMVSVEWLWLQRWRQHPAPTLFDPQELSTVSQLQERWQQVERETWAYLDGLREEDLARSITCVSTRGQRWTYPLWRMMVHLLNHQSYHRGQVTTIFRQLGVEPVKVDFLDALDAGLSLP